MAFLLCLPVAAVADELDDVRAELDAKATDLQEITERVNEFGDEVKSLDKEISALTKDIEEQQAKRADIQQQISSISKVMYKNGDQLNLVNIITSECESETMTFSMKSSSFVPAPMIPLPPRRCAEYVSAG